MNIERVRKILRWLLTACFTGVSYIHLRYTDLFLPIMPDWVPYPHDTIILTGLCELAGALALFIPRLRYLAGSMLALYAACVFPANIKHAFSHAVVGGMHLGWWYHAPRLAFQPVIIWWSLFAGGVITWPFRKNRAS